MYMSVWKEKNDIQELEGTWMAPVAGSPYENKEKGISMTLTVGDKGKRCNFTSSIQGEPDIHLQQESLYDDASFIYRKDTQTLIIREKSTGKQQSFTIEWINDQVIRSKEYNYYLENKEKSAAQIYKLRIETDTCMGYRIDNHKAESIHPLPSINTLKIASDGTIELELPAVSLTLKDSEVVADFANYYYEYTYRRDALSFQGVVTVNETNLNNQPTKGYGVILSAPAAINGQRTEKTTTVAINRNNAAFDLETTSTNQIAIDAIQTGRAGITGYPSNDVTQVILSYDPETGRVIQVHLRIACNNTHTYTYSNRDGSTYSNQMEDIYLVVK